MKTISTPLETQPQLAELHRKLKQYPKALALCNNVLDAPSVTQNARDHAWIVRACILMHTDEKAFGRMQAAPPFDASSVHWARLLCARVFSKIITTESQDEVRQRLHAELDNPQHGAAAVQDIQTALERLNQPAEEVACPPLT